MKSLFSSMIILTMLGSAIKTFGFPPNPGILASTSPNALETYIIKYLLTANLPGFILKGILNPRSDSFIL